MIELTKMNGQVFFLNPHLIEKIEARPDTVITMDSQTQYIVKESVEQIMEYIINYRKKLSIGCQE